MRLIATIMGASDSKSRNSNMANLLDYGFNMYHMQVEIKKGEVVTSKKLIKAKNEIIEIVTKKEVGILLEKTEEKKGINYEINLDKLKLPIKKGKTIGILKLKDGNKVINEVELTVKEDVEKANIIELYKRNLKKILTGNI